MIFLRFFIESFELSSLKVCVWSVGEKQVGNAENPSSHRENLYELGLSTKREGIEKAVLSESV